MKRFTDTEKWKDPWFRTLSPTAKTFWFFICDQCDNAGVWKVDWDLAEFMIGCKLESGVMQKEMNGRINILPNGSWHIVKFVKFQYGELKSRCYPHSKVIELLRSHGINDLQCSLPNIQTTLPPTLPTTLPGRDATTLRNGKDSTVQVLVLEGGVGETAVELPPGFPRSEKEAVNWAMSAGVPDDFVTQYWNESAGRGGKDEKGNPISNWAMFVKGRHGRYLNYKAEKEHNESNKRGSGHGVDRNKGTANEGKASQYRGVGKVV